LFLKFFFDFLPETSSFFEIKKKKSITIMGNCKSEPLSLQNAGTTFFTHCNSKPLQKAEDIFLSIVKIQSMIRGYLVRKKYLLHLESNRDLVLIRDLHNNARKIIFSRSLTYETFDYTLYKLPYEKPLKTIIKKIESSDGKIKYYGEWLKFFCFNEFLKSLDFSVDDIRHGRGVQIWSDGVLYEGFWRNDKANGKGRLINVEGEIYEGDWEDDKANGFGIYLSKDGTKYEGLWKDEKQNGKGKEISKQGDVYDGEFSNGQKNGFGVFQWIDGSRYEGNFHNNEIDGQGNFKFFQLL